MAAGVPAPCACCALRWRLARHPPAPVLVWRRQLELAHGSRRLAARCGSAARISPRRSLASRVGSASPAPDPLPCRRLAAARARAAALQHRWRRRFAGPWRWATEEANGGKKVVAERMRERDKVERKTVRELAINKTWESEPTYFIPSGQFNRD